MAKLAMSVITSAIADDGRDDWPRLGAGAPANPQLTNPDGALPTTSYTGVNKRQDQGSAGSNGGCLVGILLILGLVAGDYVVRFGVLRFGIFARVVLLWCVVAFVWVVLAVVWVVLW